MKKSLVVLLIAVLALSAVFAEPAMTVDGSVTAKYVVDLDKGTAGYTAPAVSANLLWKLEQPIAKVGSGKAYIDAAATFSFKLDEDFSTKRVYDLASTIKATLDKFEIVGEDWTVDFLASVGQLDFAVSAIDTAKYAPKDADGKVTGAKVKSGLTYKWTNTYDDAVSFKKDGIGTLTVNGGKFDLGTASVAQTIEYLTKAKTATTTTEYEYYNLDGSEEGFVGEGWYLVKKTTDADPAEDCIKFSSEFVSEEYALSDSVKAQFGVGYNYFKDMTEEEDGTIKYPKHVTSNYGFSGKFAYEDVFAVAGDFGYSAAYVDPEKGEVESSLMYDITTSFKYDILSVDTYFADGYMYIDTPADLYAAKNYVYYQQRMIDKDTPVDVDKLFSVKAAVDVKEISTVFTVTAKDIFNTNIWAFADKDLFENPDPAKATYPSGRTFDFVAKNTSFENYTFTTEVKTEASQKVTGVTNYENEEAGITYVGFTAAADYTEELGVKADVTVFGSRDTTDEAVAPYVTASLSYAKNGFESYYYFSTYSNVAGEPYDFTTKVSYTGKVVKLSAAAYLNTYAKPYIAEVQGYEEKAGLWLAAGIESDKLVDGALLSLSYASQAAEGATDTPYAFANGQITAACKVTF